MNSNGGGRARGLGRASAIVSLCALALLQSCSDGAASDTQEPDFGHADGSVSDAKFDGADACACRPNQKCVNHQCVGGSEGGAGAAGSGIGGQAGEAGSSASGTGGVGGDAGAGAAGGVGEAGHGGSGAGGSASICGDKVCAGGETCTSCPADCGACAPVCGNGICEAGESCGGNCAKDCAGPGVFNVTPGESIQSAMDKAQAYAKCISPTWPNHSLKESLYGKVVLLAGTHQLSSPLKTRAHVRIEAPNATIVGAGSGKHLMQVDNNGGGGYQAPAVYWTIIGGDWNANGGGGFSIVHTLSFIMQDMEIKNIGYKAHHLEINSSGGAYVAGAQNVIVRNVKMHGVATPHRLEDEALNIDYSWIDPVSKDAAAVNVANDGTVANNVLVEGCEFYDVPRGVSSHCFQADRGPPKAKPSGITVRTSSFHDIDPSLAEDPNYKWSDDGAVRAYAWQEVLIENNRFTNCATAVSVFVPSDYPTSYGSLKGFTIRNNTLYSCGRARHAGYNFPLINVDSPVSGINFWDIKITGDSVTGPWVAGDAYFVSVHDTHNCAITGNHFAPTGMGAAAEKDHNKYTAQGSTNFGTWDLSGNTVSDGSISNK